MQLLQLRYFYTVAQMLNISQAAEIHNIPQPAMSKTISKLEEELGAQLFSRRRNHLALTGAGEAFLEEVRLSLEHLDAGIDLISRNLATELPAKLRLLILLHRATMVEAFAEFRRKHPNIMLSVVNNPDETGYFDLCIAGMDAGTKRGFFSRMLLLRERINIMLAKGHPLAGRSVLRVRDLKNEHFLILNEAHACYQCFLPLARNAGFTPHIAVVSNDLYCFSKYLKMNMGVALAPEVAWREFCREDCVVIPLDVPLYREVFLYWNERDTVETPAIRLLMEEIIEFFRGLDPGGED